MSHFNLKSLAFYGIAIGSVVLLFNAVTAYGNANLKAPAKIGSRYRINAQNLPGCLKSEALFLDIQQSGIYLSGFLLPAKNNPQLETLAAEKPSLTGQLSYPNLDLSGSVPWVPNCHQPNGSGRPIRVKIQGVVQGEILTGQIVLNSTPIVAEFTAQREALKKQPGQEH